LSRSDLGAEIVIGTPSGSGAGALRIPGDDKTIPSSFLDAKN
jgi:hypothetical protein